MLFNPIILIRRRNSFQALLPGANRPAIPTDKEAVPAKFGLGHISIEVGLISGDDGTRKIRYSLEQFQEGRTYHLTPNGDCYPLAIDGTILKEEKLSNMDEDTL